MPYVLQVLCVTLRQATRVTPGIKRSWLHTDGQAEVVPSTVAVPHWLHWCTNTVTGYAPVRVHQLGSFPFIFKPAARNYTVSIFTFGILGRVSLTQFPIKQEEK